MPDTQKIESYRITAKGLIALRLNGNVALTEQLWTELQQLIEQQAIENGYSKTVTSVPALVFTKGGYVMFAEGDNK